VLGLCAGQIQAGDSERAGLLARQAELGALFDAEERVCRSRFVVTPCVDDVQQRRREALAPVRERLLQLDEAERSRRAQARREALADKARLGAARTAAAQAADAAASSASAPRERQRMLPPVAPRIGAPDTPASRDRADATARREIEATERARQTQHRQAQAVQKQADVTRRQDERARKKNPAQPLPPEASASPPR
jgi:colicin import membrane protein